ncbi:hypothetical protein ACFSMW_15390 [Virgibacillus halophilus]
MFVTLSKSAILVRKDTNSGGTKPVFSPFPTEGYQNKTRLFPLLYVIKMIILFLFLW